MNIKELAKRAIERIESMSLEELRNKFIEHGYKDNDLKPFHSDITENEFSNPLLYDELDTFI